MLEEYFKILGLPKTAKQEEIKKAFRFLAKKYHPDVSKEPNASKRFIEMLFIPRCFLFGHNSSPLRGKFIKTSIIVGSIEKLVGCN